MSFVHRLEANAKEGSHSHIPECEQLENTLRFCLIRLSNSDLRIQRISLAELIRAPGFSEIASLLFRKHIQSAAYRLQSVDTLLRVQVQVLHVDLAIQSSTRVAFIFTFASVRARSSHRHITSSQCSLYGLLRLACTRCFASCLLCFCSHHVQFIVRTAQVFTMSRFHSALHPS